MPIPLKDRVAREMADNAGSTRANITQTADVQDMDMAEAMKKINAQLPAGAPALTEDDVFVFSMELSNSNIDAYFTRMTAETLQNYADRINNKGVPLMEQHEDMIYPVGRQFSAEVTQDEGGVYRLPVMTYILRGDVNSAGISTDAIIKKIQGGVQRDVSIGFIAGSYTCSICGGPMVPYWGGRAEGVQCDHICGCMYEGQTCYAWVENGIILEGSLVYVGATPQALIQKAINSANSGKLAGNMLATAVRALHINPSQLNDTPMKAKELLKKVANSGKLSDRLKRSLEEKAAEVAPEETEEKAAEIISEEVSKVEEENKDLTEKNEELEKENNSMKADADLGKIAREELITSTLAEGVRALGDKFDKEAIEKTLRALPLEQVRGMKTHYTSIVDGITAGANNSDRMNIDPLPLGEPKEGEARGNVLVTKR